MDWLRSIRETLLWQFENGGRSLTLETTSLGSPTSVPFFKWKFRPKKNNWYFQGWELVFWQSVVFLVGIPYMQCVLSKCQQTIIPFNRFSAYFLMVHWFGNMFTLTPFGMIQFEEHVFPYWNHSIFYVCLQWMVSLRFATWFFPFRILVSRQHQPFYHLFCCEYIIWLTILYSPL